MVRSRRPLMAMSDDDEFEDIDVPARTRKPRTQDDAPKRRLKERHQPDSGENIIPPFTVRRRKLGALTDNLLLQAWTPRNAGEEWETESLPPRTNTDTRPRRTRVELRTRTTKPAVTLPSSPLDKDEEFVSAKEEVTIIEDVSLFDDTFHSCNSEGPEFGSSTEKEKEAEEDEEDEPEDDDDDFVPDSPPRNAAKPKVRGLGKRQPKPSSVDIFGDDSLDDESEDDEDDEPYIRSSKTRALRRQNTQSRPELRVKGEAALADSMSKLRLDGTEDIPKKTSTLQPTSDLDTTPPSTPPKPKSQPGLLSPQKLPRIPNTPHHHTSEMFWSQEFVDDWNDEHSPRKQLFPDAMAARRANPVKANPEKKSGKAAEAAKKSSERETKRAFEKAKHEMAATFLQELDTTITEGKLTKLAASTGGIQLIWTNKLNTTAGRANWKRETIYTRAADGSSATTTKYHHHASIELAEKVINDPHRLLNVLAHEFCHLANFMVSGVTNNPHGREFKAWAAQCSRHFGDRGVQVTTKHSYDIDFKYVWTCTACATEFKRHSRSIDPARHRCGSCKSALVQTKPVPRKSGGGKKDGGGGDGKESGTEKVKVVSEWQAFVKEQMRVVKAENPKSPQKEIMKIVASRWAVKKSEAAAAKAASGSLASPDRKLEDVEGGMGELSV
ncbi:SprT-like family-domain-containing protein [Chaetomium sp. MPI-SDFR-AT-0129]|nr:SprT-like family-domain-containing protein [Chaetomium sp. MPI-SDFR-AT-0129]